MLARRIKTETLWTLGEVLSNQNNGGQDLAKTGGTLISKYFDIFY